MDDSAVTLRGVGPTLFVLVLAVAVPSGFIMLAGKDPLLTWGTLLGYTLGTLAGFSEALVYAIPLTLLGVGIAIAFRAGIYNIGGDGQLIFGAVLAVACARWAAACGPAGLAIFLLVGFLGGGAAGMLVGWLRTRFGANEIIVTIMLNYVSFQVLAWVIRGPLQEATRVFPRSFRIAGNLILPVIMGGTRIHAGVFIAASAAIIVFLVLRHTAFGFRLRVLGENPSVAAYAGIDAARTTIVAMLLSGGLAGLAGAVEVAGVHQNIEDGFDDGLGLVAIAVALMARLNPLAVPLAAVLFGLLYAGSGVLQRQLAIPFPLVWVIEGVVVLAFLAFDWATRRRRVA